MLQTRVWPRCVPTLGRLQPRVARKVSAPTRRPLAHGLARTIARCLVTEASSRLFAKSQNEGGPRDPATGDTEAVFAQRPVVRGDVPAELNPHLEEVIPVVGFRGRCHRRGQWLRRLRFALGDVRCLRVGRGGQRHGAGECEEERRDSATSPNGAPPTAPRTARTAAADSAAISMRAKRLTVRGGSRQPGQSVPLPEQRAAIPLVADGPRTPRTEQGSPDKCLELIQVSSLQCADARVNG